MSIDTSSPSAWLRQRGQPVSKGSLEDLFLEEPVSLDVFVRDQRFLRMGALSLPQYDLVRYAERVYLPDLYPKMQAEWGDYWSYIRMVNLLTAEVGKGGGKDLIARLASLRIAYLLLCLRNPKEYFDMPPDESIHLLNVASTRDQARRAFFEPLTRIVARGWFEDKCEPTKSEVTWERGLTTISGSSDAEAQEGLNLILGVGDEIDAFRTVTEIERHAGHSVRTPVRSAEGILDMLQTSAESRFPYSYKNIRISYPRYLGSTIQVLLEKARKDLQLKGESSKHYVIGPLASWEMNPLLARGEFVKIPGLDVEVPISLAATFESDFDKACGAYLCRPGKTQRPPYFSSKSLIESALYDGAAVSVNHCLVANMWHPVFTIPASLQPISGAIYAVHVDLALNGDRAGFAMAHVVSTTTLEGSVPGEGGGPDFGSVEEIIASNAGEIVIWENLPTVKVDVALTVEADMGAIPPREIPLRFARMLVFELRKRGFDIQRVSYDGYQSVESKQAIQIAGIDAVGFSVDKSEQPWLALRQMIEESRVFIPRSELVVDELLGLYQDPKTGKINHSTTTTKDLSDAISGAVHGAVQVGGGEQIDSDDGGNLFDVEGVYDVSADLEDVDGAMRGIPVVSNLGWL